MIQNVLTWILMMGFKKSKARTQVYRHCPPVVYLKPAFPHDSNPDISKYYSTWQEALSWLKWSWPCKNQIKYTMHPPIEQCHAHTNTNTIKHKTQKYNIKQEALLSQLSHNSKLHIYCVRIIVYLVNGQ